MINKVSTVHKVGKGPHEFKRYEFIIPDDLRLKIEKQIRDLISGFDLFAVWDDGRMVKLTPEETNTFKTKGCLPGADESIEEHFGQLYRPARLEDFKNQPENCEQVTRHIPALPETIAELLSNDMAEVVEGLEEHTDDPYSYVVITNAPIGFPFGQKDDIHYQKFYSNEAIKDRHPIAEAFQYGLLQASGHTIDAPFPGRAFAPVTPNLSKIDDSDNRLLEELSASQPFYMHIDGANYDEYSSQVCLAFGSGDAISETIYVHTHAVLDQLDELDVQLGRFTNGMGRTEVLKLDIFEHGPGAYSTCLNVVKAPVLYEDLDGVLRPRINFVEGRLRIRNDKLPELSLTNEDVLEAVNALAKASDNCLNQHATTLETGQVICFSGELLHGRSAFSVDKNNPRFALRLRGTSSKYCALIEERNRLNPNRSAQFPGR